MNAEAIARLWRSLPTDSACAPLACIAVFFRQQQSHRDITQTAAFGTTVEIVIGPLAFAAMIVAFAIGTHFFYSLSQVMAART